MEVVCNRGMSGKVFLDNTYNANGREFKSLDEALQFSTDNGISIDRIDFNYISSGGVQMFRKFKVVR